MRLLANGSSREYPASKMIGRRLWYLTASYSEAGRRSPREVPMDDPNDPYSRDNLSWNWRFGGPKWRPFTRLPGSGRRLPPPPGPPPRPSKAEREQERRAEARAERLHLADLTSAGVIVMGVVLGAAVVGLVLVVVSHH
jgi:hypothetical protein